MLWWLEAKNKQDKYANYVVRFRRCQKVIHAIEKKVEKCIGFVGEECNFKQSGQGMSNWEEYF